MSKKLIVEEIKISKSKAHKSKQSKKPKSKSSWFNVPDTLKPNQLLNETMKVKKNVGLPRRSRLTNRLQSRNISILDKLTENSTESMLQTMFAGVSGVSRGIASFGQEPSGLCRIKGAIDIAVPATSYTSISIAPSQVANSNYIVWANGATVPNSPYNLGTTSAGGPFAPSGIPGTNPTESWRVVRGAFRLIPESNITNQGGIVTVGYNPCLYLGPPTAGNLRFSYSTSNVLNLTFSREFKGTDDIMLQTVPNESELVMSPSTAYANTPFQTSGFVIIIYNPTSVSMSWRVEQDSGIEFAPNDAYRPFINKTMPMNLESSLHFVNQFIMHEWDKCLIALKGQYDSIVAVLDPFEHHLTSSYLAGTNAGIAPYALPSSQPGYMESAYDVITDTCSKMQDYTGVDVCGGLSSAGGRLAGALLNQGPVRNAIRY